MTRALITRGYINKKEGKLGLDLFLGRGGQNARWNLRNPPSAALGFQQLGARHSLSAETEAHCIPCGRGQRCLSFLSQFGSGRQLCPGRLESCFSKGRLLYTEPQLRCSLGAWENHGQGKSKHLPPEGCG